VDEYLAEGVDPGDVQRWARSASVLHSNGDAMDLAVIDGRIVGVRGRGDDRVNHGRLGPKDLFGWQATHSPDRLTRPLVRRDGELVETDWDTALNQVVDRTKALLAERDPDPWGFLHHRSAVPGGVLHPGRDRTRGVEHQPHGRQHPAVHRDRGGGAEGDLRLRRAARLLHRVRRREPSTVNPTTCAAVRWRC
jgi:hypothetical protein